MYVLKSTSPWESVLVWSLFVIVGVPRAGAGVFLRPSGKQRKTTQQRCTCLCTHHVPWMLCSSVQRHANVAACVWDCVWMHRCGEFHKMEIDHIMRNTSPIYPFDCHLTNVISKRYRAHLVMLRTAPTSCAPSVMVHLYKWVTDCPKMETYYNQNEQENVQSTSSSHQWNWKYAIRLRESHRHACCFWCS